jgi:plastocyanin
MTGDKVVIGMSSRLILFIALSALILGLMLSLTSCVEPEGELGGEQEQNEAGGEQEQNEEGGEEEAEDASTAEVGLTEYEIEMPTSLSAGSQTFTVTNNGTTEHNFEVEGQGIEQAFETNLSPGETQTMQLDLAPGTYVVYCPVGNHQDQGMELQLTVTE